MSRVDASPEKLSRLDPQPERNDSVILQCFLEKIGVQASSDELMRFLSSPDSYTPCVTFNRPSVPTPEVTPSAAPGPQSPFGFSMDFWLEICQGVGRFKVGEESYSLMVFPPPSEDANAIEDTFAKFGVKLKEAFSLNRRMAKNEFFNICKENVSILLGGYVSILLTSKLAYYFAIGFKEGHFVGGVEKSGLCSTMAVCTALFDKDYKEKLCKIVNDTEREESVIFDYLTEENITPIRSAIEKYSQNTAVAIKNSILSVMNRQVGYLKGFETSICRNKLKYLAFGKQPSKNYANYLSRPFIAESSKIKSGPDKTTTVEVKNWFADNYFCGERYEEGAFFELIHLVVFTDIAVQRKMMKANIPPEVNLQFMKPGMMDMILFTDNEMKPVNGRVMYKWSYQELLNVHSAPSRFKKKSASIFFTGNHFELFGKDPLHDILGNQYLGVLFNDLVEKLWMTFQKHYPTMK